MMLPSPANGAQIVECPHRVDICLSNGEAEGTSDELAYSHKENRMRRKEKMKYHLLEDRAVDYLHACILSDFHRWPL